MFLGESEMAALISKMDLAADPVPDTVSEVPSHDDRASESDGESVWDDFDGPAVAPTISLVRRATAKTPGAPPKDPLAKPKPKAAVPKQKVRSDSQQSDTLQADMKALLGEEGDDDICGLPKDVVMSSSSKAWSQMARAPAAAAPAAPGIAEDKVVDVGDAGGASWRFCPEEAFADDTEAAIMQAGGTSSWRMAPEDSPAMVATLSDVCSSPVKGGSFRGGLVFGGPPGGASSSGQPQAPKKSPSLLQVGAGPDMGRQLSSNSNSKAKPRGLLTGIAEATASATASMTASGIGALKRQFSRKNSRIESQPGSRGNSRPGSAERER
eukprot:gnl/TRDRNA2_/TRDRNA2_146760_c0_seq2.p1 gnl/TRDRNA2_/TRDRNA2_146760_c0~~gnl/TRDRNA2_/TRDRNA2_146760_c0_seq2.p1  ORF type:complete len:371 (-),score=62.10 gnl/TRDRNA2_/TRDRNA2_146760_c0_seq2:50-1024(-)